MIPPSLLALCCALPCQPDAAAHDKAAYHLFNPTPRELMREMSTDRPDTTESPYTVDAGHLQIELSFIDWSRSEDDSDRVDTLTAAPFNFKLGLLNSTDIQFVFDPWIREDSRASGVSEGVGDFTIRLKQNLWGNDGGDTAMAIMPYIKLPTGDDEVSNGKVEGGFIVPFAVALPADFGLGLVAEADFVRNSADDGYDTEFLHSATIGHSIVGDLGGFIEYAGVATTAPDGHYQATFNAGLTLALTDSIILDTGVRIGLTQATEDLGFFVGMSLRY